MLSRAVLKNVELVKYGFPFLVFLKRNLRGDNAKCRRASCNPAGERMWEYGIMAQRKL